MAASKSLVKSRQPRKPGVITQSALADLLFAQEMVQRLSVEVANRERKIMVALELGAALERGRYFALIKKKRLKVL